ncbi:hypothetical protein B0H11DRAFT_1926006 [Mycena galericulata]|nr:hypothetical protein B0H11DRAFT_1926006 [Mycena galericulata]
MGTKRSEKQKLIHSNLNNARWAHKTQAKENVLPSNTASPPRSKTRAQAYISKLQETINTQSTRITNLESSLSTQSAESLSLRAELSATNSRLESLEETHTETIAQLSSIQHDLKIAEETISEQAIIIKQKTQRINRLIRDKAALQAQLACRKQQLLDAVLRAEEAEGLTASSNLRIETLLRTVERLHRTIDTQKQDKLIIQKKLKNSKMREKRGKYALMKTRIKLKTKSTYSLMSRRAYNTQFRTLALACTRAGCAQARLGPLLVRIGKVFGVKLERTMSRRTVGRIITEAGIKVRLQLGHELARAKAICLSSDGTSDHNIKYEGRHMTYSAPTYSTDQNAPQEAFKTRVIEINSPLGRRDALEGYSYEKDDLWRKTVAYNSDHASDVRSAARKCAERKQSVIEGDLGRKEIALMTESELEDALWDVVQETCDDPDTLDPSSLPDEIRVDAFQSLAAHLGSAALESLPQDRQQDHNCSKAGMAGMAAAYEPLGLTPPVLLANKDNSATIALGDEADSAAVERALKASHRGGYKLVSICGNLFRHQDDKKGHQDLHRHFFTKRQREKDAEAAAEKQRLEAIIVITDPAKLKKLPIKKKGVASLRDQLDVRRDLWKDDILLKTKLKDIAKKDDMLEAILAADHRYSLLVYISESKLTTVLAAAIEH